MKAVAIRVTPDSALVFVGEAQRFIATGVSATGGVVPLGNVIWRGTPQAGGDILPAGMVTGRRPSAVIISASEHSATGSGKLVVLPRAHYTVISANGQTLPATFPDAPCIPALPGRTASLSVNGGFLEFYLRLSGFRDQDTTPVAKLWLYRHQDCSTDPSKFGLLNEPVLKGATPFEINGYEFRFINGGPAEKGLLYPDSLSFTQNDGALPITWQLRLKVLPDG